MNIECNWTRDDLKKELKEKRRKTSRVILILAVLFYFYITYYGFVYDVFDSKILFVGFVVFFVIISLILMGIDKLYVFFKLRRNDKRTHKAYGKYIINMDEEKISSKFNDMEIVYNWKDVTRKVFKKNYFWIRSKDDKIGLMFKKNVLKDDYDKVLEYVKEQLSK